MIQKSGCVIMKVAFDDCVYIMFEKRCIGNSVTDIIIFGGIDMLKFAFKNMLTKKVQMILIIISIAVSTGVAMLAYNVSQQVSEGITNTAGYYSAIIGSAGSSTQLAMNTMYFTDEPCGTIPYSIMNELLADSRVTKVIPFAMADSYNGYSVVGTTPDYLENRTVSDGRMFDKDTTFEVVVGSNVAKTCRLSVGDEIHTSHSLGEEHHQAFKVVGILAESHTVYDNTVFTELKSIWEVHEHEDHDHEDHDHEDADDHGDDHEAYDEDADDHGDDHEAYDEDTDGHDDNHDGYEDGNEENIGTPQGHFGGNAGSTGGNNDADATGNGGNTGSSDGVEESADTGHEEHEHAEQNMVCSFCVKTKNPSFAMTLVNDYDGKILNINGESYILQAIEPMSAVRAVLEDTDSTKYIVYALCGIILAMNVLVIAIITLLNMYYASREINLMRLIGISIRKINRLYMIENGISGVIACVIAFIMSRLAMSAMGGFVADMGVVLDRGKVYGAEMLILIGVLVLSILPTVICTNVMSRRYAK